MFAPAFHARVLQALLQSGSRVYPLVELVDCRLLANSVNVTQCQFSFSVSAYREAGIKFRIIFYFHILKFKLFTALKYIQMY